MNRTYTSKALRSLFIQFKKVNPGFKLTTHVIIGYPGETEADFEASLDFIRDREIGIDEVGIIPYSDRPGTMAFELAGKVDPEVIRQRMERLIRISEQEHKIYFTINNLLVGDKTFLLPW